MKRLAKASQVAVIAIVVLFVAALAIRDPRGFGHALAGFGGKLADAGAALWSVVRGVAAGT